MGTAPLCFGRSASSRPISPRARVAPIAATDDTNAAMAGAAAPRRRPSSPARVVWEGQEGSSRETRKTPRTNGSAKARGSVRAHTKDSSGNAVLLSVSTQVLKKYEVKALIGKGSFSQVLRIENKTTEELFALKVIEKQLVQGDRYTAELTVLRRVQHPNIVTLYDVFHSNHKVYLVLELAAGGDLFDRVYSKGYYSEIPGQRIVRMIISGVAYLHSVGITHRDLKLENILFHESRDDSKIVISDFGLSHMRNGTVESDPMTTTCGSAEYLAPEMLQGEEYSELIDMWALGVITYVVLSRRMPFMDESRARLYHKITKGQFSFTEEPWSEVSLAGKDFICKLLCVDPLRRLCAREASEHHWFSEAV